MENVDQNSKETVKLHPNKDSELDSNTSRPMFPKTAVAKNTKFHSNSASQKSIELSCNYSYWKHIKDCNSIA